MSCETSALPAAIRPMPLQLPCAVFPPAQAPHPWLQAESPVEQQSVPLQRRAPEAPANARGRAPGVCAAPLALPWRARRRQARPCGQVGSRGIQQRGGDCTPRWGGGTSHLFSSASQPRPQWCRQLWSLRAHPPLPRRRLAEVLQAPVAPRRTKLLENHGDVREDAYYWLRDDDRADPDVIAHLEVRPGWLGRLLVAGWLQRQLPRLGRGAWLVLAVWPEVCCRLREQRSALHKCTPLVLGGLGPRLCRYGPVLRWACHRLQLPAPLSARCSTARTARPRRLTAGRRWRIRRSCRSGCTGR
jgi:hypothetical protein